MKTNQRIIIILMFMMMPAYPTFNAQNKREIKEQREQAIKEQIIAEKYKISVNTAYPRRGRTVHLSSPYSVEIRNDSVISYLPFYGRAYSIPYGGGEGLIFQAPLDEYEMEMIKKEQQKLNLQLVARKISSRSILLSIPTVRQVSMSICKTENL